MSSFSLVAAPAAEPLSLARVKRHLRIDVSDEDEDLQDLISISRDHLEQAYELAFITQTWDFFLDNFPWSWPQPFGWPTWAQPSVIDIPKQPLKAVTSVKYTDSSGVQNNFVDFLPDVPGNRVGLKYGKTWPQVALQPIAGVVIRMDFGYGDTGASTPPSARSAQLLYIGHLYENREQVVIEQRIRPIDLPRGVQDLMMPFDWRVYAA